MAENENNKEKIQEGKPQTNEKLTNKIQRENPLGEESPDNFSKFSLKNEEDMEDAENLKDKPARK